MKRILYLMIIVMALSGCRHKELWMGSEHYTVVQVRFDWSRTETRVQNTYPPTSMSLYLFPEDGNVPLYSEFSGHEGGSIRVPFGSYRAIAMNHDNEAVLLRGTGTFLSLEAYTRAEDLLAPLGSMGTRAPMPAETAEERSILEPELYWTSHKENIQIKILEGQEIVMPMQDAIQQISVRITDVDNIDKVSAISMALSTVAGSWFPGPAVSGSEKVTVPFAGEVKADEMTARATCFGHCPDGPSQHFLTVYAIMESGAKYYYTFNVTDQYHAQWSNPVVYINLSGLPLPNELETGFGSTDVDQWLTVDVNISMGGGNSN